MSSMLRMSEATALGLHAVVRLAEGDERLTVEALAEVLQASGAHLAKVLQRLSSAGIVVGTRGPRGGFRLAVDPKDLHLIKVYEALEGPFTTGGCLFDKPVCERVSCIMGGLIERVDQEIREYLVGTSVADLVPSCRREA